MTFRCWTSDTNLFIYSASATDTQMMQLSELLQPVTENTYPEYMFVFYGGDCLRQSKELHTELFIHTFM